jgi:hypothetical protein
MDPDRWSWNEDPSLYNKPGNLHNLVIPDLSGMLQKDHLWEIFSIWAMSPSIIANYSQHSPILSNLMLSNLMMVDDLFKSKKN